MKNRKRNEQLEALRRQHADRLRREMQAGVVRRAATFADKRRQQDKRACRGRVVDHG